MREPHHECASRWASTAAAGPCAPSFLYAFAARLPTVLIEIPSSAAMSLCVMSRPMRSSVAHSRAVSGRGWDFGDRLTSSGPTPVVPHASTRWPKGAARCPGAYCAHPGQEPPYRGTRAAPGRSRHRARRRSSHRRAGCGQNCGQTASVVLASRAESAHFVRRGWDSNPREPCDSSGFQDRKQHAQHRVSCTVSACSSLLIPTRPSSYPLVSSARQVSPRAPRSSRHWRNARPPTCP